MSAAERLAGGLVAVITIAVVTTLLLVARGHGAVPQPAVLYPATIQYDGRSWDCATVENNSTNLDSGIPVTVTLACDTPQGAR